MNFYDGIDDFLATENCGNDQKNANRFVLKRFYKDLTTENITAETVIERINKGINSISEVMRFLVYINTREELKDKRLKRLTDNISVYSNHTPKEMSAALLNADNELYDFFIERGYLNYILGRSIMISLYQGVTIENSDPVITEACETRMREIAFDDDLLLQTRYEMISKIMLLANRYLNNIPEMTVDEVISLILTGANKAGLPKMLTRGYSGTLFGIIGVLDREGKLRDDRLSYFMRYLFEGFDTKTKNSRSANDYIKVLSSPHIDRWTIIKPDYYNGRMLVYIDIPKSELRDTFIQFMIKNCGSVSMVHKALCENFSISLEGKLPSRAGDLTYDDFKKQLFYFEPFNPKYNSKLVTVTGVVCAWYLYVWTNENQHLFRERNISPLLIQKQGAASLILDGYEPIPYNPFDPVPDEDKWILWFGSNVRNNSDIALNGSVSWDFSKIDYKEYRKLAKTYLWTSRQAGFTAKTAMLDGMTEFLNFLYHLKSDGTFIIYPSGKFNSFLTTNMMDLNASEAAAYRDHIAGKYEGSALNDRVNDIMPFLKYISGTNLFKVVPDIDKIITVPKKNKENNSNPIQDEEFTKLLGMMYEMKDRSDIDALCFYALMLTVYSDMRITGVLGLSRDCVEQAVFPDKFYLLTRRKMSYGEKVRVAIEDRMKTVLKLSAEISDRYRRDCPSSDIRELLFICPSKRGKTIKTLPRDRVNLFLTEACKKAGIKRYTCASFRDTRKFFILLADDFIKNDCLKTTCAPQFSTERPVIRKVCAYISSKLGTIRRQCHGRKLIKITCNYYLFVLF